MAAAVSFYASGANPDPDIADEYQLLDGEEGNPDNDCLKRVFNVVVAARHYIDELIFQLQILLSPADSLPWIEAFKFAESIRRENDEALPTPIRKELATAFADIVRAELAASNRKARACTRCYGSSLFHLRCPSCEPEADPLTEIPEVANPVPLLLHSTPSIHPTNITIAALNQAAAKAANVTRAKQRALCTPRTTQSAAVQAAADEVDRCLGDGSFGTTDNQSNVSNQQSALGGIYSRPGLYQSRIYSSQRVVVPLHPTALSPIQSPVTPAPQYTSSSISSGSSTTSDGAIDQLQGPETPTQITHSQTDTSSEADPMFSAAGSITAESLPKALTAIFEQSVIAKQQQLGDISKLNAAKDASVSDAEYMTDQSPFPEPFTRGGSFKPRGSPCSTTTATSLSGTPGKSVTFELDAAGKPLASVLVSSHALDMGFEEPSRFATAMEHSIYTASTVTTASPLPSPGTSCESPGTSFGAHMHTVSRQHSSATALSPDSAASPNQVTPPLAGARTEGLGGTQLVSQPCAPSTSQQYSRLLPQSIHDILGPATPRPDDPLPPAPSASPPVSASKPNKGHPPAISSTSTPSTSTSPASRAPGTRAPMTAMATVPEAQGTVNANNAINSMKATEPRTDNRPVVPLLNLPKPEDSSTPFARPSAMAPVAQQAKQALEERRKSHAQASSTVSQAVAAAAMVAANITPPGNSAGGAGVLTWTENGAAMGGGSSPVNKTHQPKMLRHASQPVLTEIEPESASKENSELQRAKSTSRHRSTPSYHSFGIQLGQGSFGTVQKGLWRGRMVAIKTIRVKGTDVRAQEHAMREAAITYALDHPNIIKTHSWDIQVAAELADATPPTPGTRNTPRNVNTPHITPRGATTSSRTSPSSTPDWIVSMVVELCDADLVQALRASCFHGTDRRPILPYILKIALDVAHGMEHLHSRRIIHGDMKSTNVLLKHQKNAISGFMAKVADLGMSYKLPRGANEIVGIHSGTRGYIAPEVQRDGIISLAADVYSYGVVLWELYHAKPAVASRTFPQFQRGCPKQLEALVRCCLSQNPAMRPTFGGIMLQLCALIDSVNVQRQRSSSSAR